MSEDFPTLGMPTTINLISSWDSWISIWEGQELTNWNTNIWFPPHSLLDFDLSSSPLHQAAYSSTVHTWAQTNHMFVFLRYLVCSHLTSLIVESCCLRRLVKSTSLSPFLCIASSTSCRVKIRGLINFYVHSENKPLILSSLQDPSCSRQVVWVSLVAWIWDWDCDRRMGYGEWELRTHT